MRQMKITPAKTLALAAVFAAGSFIFTSKLMENGKLMQVKPLKSVEKTVPAKKAEKEDLSPPVRNLAASSEKKGSEAAAQAKLSPTFRKSTLKRARNYLVTHGVRKGEADSLLADPRVEKQALRFPKAGATRKKMTYEKYKSYFKLDELAPKGVQFYLVNRECIDSKEKETGVPSALAMSHYGIESIYGDSTGHHRAVNIFLTRMETNPRRSGFALSELASLLRLCKKYGKDPLEVKGSDWGAITPAQAIPTSLENFDRRHPCGTFEELVSARNSIAFVFDYLMRAGATNRGRYALKGRNYRAAYAYNHSDWYARLAMEFAVMMETRLLAERIGGFGRTGPSMF